MSSSAPTWLITGTSAGLGLALAQFVLSQGHNLVSVSRHSSPPEQLTEYISTLKSNTKPKFLHLTLDLSLTRETTLKIAVADFLSNNPEVQIDILVNNAGVASFHPLEKLPSQTLTHTFAVNFFSPLWLIQSLLPYMRSPAWKQNGHEKVIMNMSSTQGLVADASETAYDASKHALESMSGTLAAEVAPFGIRVLVVSLGSLRTAFAVAGQRNGMYVDRKSGNGATETTEADQKLTSDDPYEDPSHPAKIRMTACENFANMPRAARGDVQKASRILFSAVMKSPRSLVNEALEKQRSTNKNDGTGKARFERVVLGADGFPKIQAEVERLKLEVESCRAFAALADCDDLL